MLAAGANLRRPKANEHGGLLGLRFTRSPQPRFGFLGAACLNQQPPDLEHRFGVALFSGSAQSRFGLLAAADLRQQPPG